MSEQTELNCETTENFFNKENFKSCFARSVVVNSHYKQPAKTADSVIKETGQITENKTTFRESDLKSPQETPVRYRKNIRHNSVDDSRRFSCGSILSRRLSMNSMKRNEIPVENIYNHNKLETVQWQLKEIEKSRDMYKAVMKQVVTFLEKAHVSLGYLGNRLNKKNSVSRSKSEHYIVGDNSTSTQSQRSLVEEHVTSWNHNKKQDINPEEIPPEKLSQEAFRLWRTVQSLLNTQEPNLANLENLNLSEEPSDIEFLAQLAREFPSPSDSNKPQRATSFSVSPKLILPENDIRISTAFNRKLSLQLNEFKKNASVTGKFSRSDFSRGSVTESECYSISGAESTGNGDSFSQGSEVLETRNKNGVKTSNSPVTGSISSMEDESGFSSLNSFQDVGLPLVNSSAIDEASARRDLLKSMLHTTTDYSSIKEQEQNSYEQSTLRASPSPEQCFQKRSEYKLRENNINEIKLWQKSTRDVINGNETKNANIPQIGHKRWHSTPDQQNNSQSLKVLWV